MTQSMFLSSNLVYIYNNYIVLKFLLIMSRTRFRGESKVYSCLNVKELLARNRRNIWSLNDSNEIQTHNLLVQKRTLNHLPKLTKRLSCVVITYLYGAFDCMLLLCHVRISCLNVKELLAQNKRDIWILSDSN